MDKQNITLNLILVINIAIIATSLFFIGQGINAAIEKASSISLKEIFSEHKNIKPDKTSIKKITKEKFILDDFDNDITANNLGLKNGVFGKYGGKCEASIFNIDSRKVLKLNFDITGSGKAYAYYWTDLGTVDISFYKHISFLAKGIKGNEAFNLIIADGKNRDKIFVSVTVLWQKITIPLINFSESLKWDKMNGLLSFCFESEEGENVPLRGVVYIDDITFE